MKDSSPLIITIKRFDLSIPLPEYKTAGAAALDLAARVSLEIPAGKIGYVPLNIALQLPQNTFALMAARSSLHKRGLQLINGIGIGDSDFCGDTDEYQAALRNFSDAAVLIEKGERLVQLIVLERTQLKLVEVEHLSEQSRGGFGTTGRV